MRSRDPSYGCLFFDLDGTLTDPRRGILACIRYALLTLEKPVPADEALNKFIGPPLQESFRLLVGESLVDQAVSLYRQRFRTVGMFENYVYPGISEALSSIASAGWRLFVVTSKPFIFAIQILHHFHLDRYFAGVHGAELSGLRADKTELIAHVLVNEGLAPRNVIMIGDRGHDMVGARNNDVRAAGVLWGYGTSEELLLNGAETLYRSVNAMVDDLVSP